MGENVTSKGVKRVNEKVATVEVVEMMDFQSGSRSVASNSAKQAGMHSGRPPDPVRLGSDAISEPKPSSPNSAQFATGEGEESDGNAQSTMNAAAEDVRMQDEVLEGSQDASLPSSSQVRP